LAITDGEQSQILPLTLEELRTGSFVYFAWQQRHIVFGWIYPDSRMAAP